MLSKSNYKLALDCPKALWLEVHMPDDKSLIGDLERRRMKLGTEIGELAKGRFPNGKTVPVWEFDNETAADLTLDWMNSDLDVIFEATFVRDGQVARVDILLREPGGWRIIEVKASSRYKKEKHLADVSFQASLFTRCGHSLVGSSLMHLNSEYVWDGNPWDVDSLFSITDISNDVSKVINEVPATAESLIAMIANPAYPPVDGASPYFDPVIQSKCKGCAFKEHCSARVPGDHIYFLGMHHSRTKKLLGNGIRSITEIPSDQKMSAQEDLRYRAFLSRQPVIAASLQERLAEIQYPAHLIDFETLRPDLPLFQGHSPFQLLPFQWSSHTLAEAPAISYQDPTQGHHEFIHTERSDPRVSFVESLLTVLDSGGSILHYHDYEKTVVRELVADGVPGAEKIESMFDRFIDLRKILEDCYADHRFKGKTSIKAVLPVIAPQFSYKGLVIQNGDQAQVEYSKMLTGELDEVESQKLFLNLLEYCKLDTWAMVEILKALAAF